MDSIDSCFVSSESVGKGLYQGLISLISFCTSVSSCITWLCTLCLSLGFMFLVAPNGNPFDFWRFSRYCFLIGRDDLCAVRCLCRRLRERVTPAASHCLLCLCMAMSSCECFGHNSLHAHMLDGMWYIVLFRNDVICRRRELKVEKGDGWWRVVGVDWSLTRSSRLWRNKIGVKMS